MPVFSLPSPWGIGTLGRAARDFLDFLALAGQSCWQVLPMGPTSYGDSPYQSFSSFAGNPYFVDLDDLCAEGLLQKKEIAGIPWSGRPDRVDYAALHTHRFPVLRRACSRLAAGRREELARFCQKEKDWLPDYCLFMALKDRFGGKAWQEWPEPLRLRDPEALKKAREELREETDFWAGVQFLFFRQWEALRRYAGKQGISIIGDLPIYVALDSADVWANPEQFQLDAKGRPVEVAGCPPDAFSDDGQLWGNPLFDWSFMEKDRYHWWMKRIAFQFRLYDTLRIDHFRGFEAYYAIPAGDETARNGRWRPGPGYRFFQEMKKQLGDRDIIAEDLGYLTEGVHELLRKTGFPGMKVLEFAFGKGMPDSAYQPHNYPRHCVVYAGTHDNDTILGWLKNCTPGERTHARRYMRLNAGEGWNWGVIRTAWSSPAELAVVQFQDLLGLGSEGRINLPSTVGTNWQWRCASGDASAKLARKVRGDMKLYHRMPESGAH